ncbi:hypothetical protein HELRODRAFT_180890 [Helobdella robusta]|uniref:alpha-1,6-mannosyl-glycoprotein 6-beta-N-acetylglucosaminyltransferase n=1 Tax=Helobdella robusta TaxID=6412 RepID=T1FGD3_HELRO|nr:hypothetical protein HELRODRAFT_180890 [Helobdella robusta]ESN93571.1 hypothetical protein HELRODRAFT_180890 [Helobdella robusta]
MPVRKKYGRPTPFTIIKPTYKAFTTILLVFCLWTLFYVLLNSDDEDDDENANVSLHGAYSLVDRDEFLFKKINRKAPHDPNPDHHIIASSSSSSSNVGLNFEKSTTFNFLLEHMSMDWHFWWMSTRLEAIWPQVKSEAFKIVGDCEEFHPYSRKKIIITPGLLTLTNFASPQTIKNGGSLGELMQWADLVAGCLALCQQVVVRSNLKVVANELKAMSLSSLEKNKNGIRTSEDQGCAGADEVDIIFTDIPGYRALPQQITQLYKYKFRILDVYGTEPAYNDLAFIKAHNLSVGWGGLDLNPKQFYTMFPHTPDNSFLGFMITKDQIYNRHANYNDDNDINNGNINNKDDDKRVNNNNNHNEDDNPIRFQKLLPEGSELLGIQDVNSYKKLLSSAKVCVGLGDPIESPSPLLALASGCIFLNPAKNLTLFGKPTSRIITSQHPYLERYIKEPHVFTFDAHDSKQLEAVMQRIAKIKDFAPVFPYAFSVRGFLHNLNDRLLGQNFCTDNNIKRSKSTNDHYNFYLADGNHIDCKELCYDKNLICELDHFIHLNHVNSFKRFCHFISKSIFLFLIACNNTRPLKT